MNCQEFFNNVIAQNGNHGYDASGYVVIEDKGKILIFQYGHCSCYGTWDDIAGCEDNVADLTDRAFWVGTIDEFKLMAEKKLDPHMPGRESDSQDCDHELLIDIYKQTLDYYENAESVGG